MRAPFSRHRICTLLYCIAVGAIVMFLSRARRLARMSWAQTPSNRFFGDYNERRQAHGVAPEVNWWTHPR